MPVELALSPDSRRNDDVPALVAAARGAGFEALGISVDRVDAAAAASFASAGLRCHELLALLVGDDAAATLAAAERLASAAPVMGARWVNTFLRAGLRNGIAETI